MIGKGVSTVLFIFFCCVGGCSICLKWVCQTSYLLHYCILFSHLLTCHQNYQLHSLHKASVRTVYYHVSGYVTCESTSSSEQVVIEQPGERTVLRKKSVN